MSKYDEAYWLHCLNDFGNCREFCSACGAECLERLPKCPECGRKMMNYKPEKKENEMKEKDVKEKKAVDHFKTQLEIVLDSIKQTKRDIEMTLRMLNGTDTSTSSLSKADYMHARLFDICNGADTSIRNLDNLCSDIHNFEGAIINSYVSESEEKPVVNAEWFHSITEVPDESGVFKVRLVCSECENSIPIGKKSKKCPYCGANMTNYKKEEKEMKENLTKVSPWAEHAAKLEELFKWDPEVTVKYNNDIPEVKLLVSDHYKAEALRMLLPSVKTFGSVNLLITVVPGNMNTDDPARLFDEAFSDNGAFAGTKSIPSSVMGNQITYVMFTPEVVQYYNDNLGDPNGNRSTLYQELAKEVFRDDLKGVFFCTDEKDSE